MSLRSIFCDIFKCQEYAELKAEVTKISGDTTSLLEKVGKVSTDLLTVTTMLLAVNQAVEALDTGAITEKLRRIESLVLPKSVSAMVFGAEGIAVGDALVVGFFINSSDPITEIEAFGFGGSGEGGLVYNTDELTFLGVEKGILTHDWTSVSGNEVSPGSVILGGFAGDGTPIASDSGELFIVNFQVASDFVESEIQFKTFIDDLKGFSPDPLYVKITR